MLKSITKRYVDESDMKKFKFVFYCDCCGKGISSDVIEYQNAFQKKLFLTNGEREARAILYANAHEAAYERANNVVRLEMNCCEVCKDIICEECSQYLEELGGGICCTKCAEKLKKQG